VESNRVFTDIKILT